MQRREIPSSYFKSVLLWGRKYISSFTNKFHAAIMFINLNSLISTNNLMPLYKRKACFEYPDLFLHSYTLFKAENIHAFHNNNYIKI